MRCRVQPVLCIPCTWALKSVVFVQLRGSYYLSARPFAWASIVMATSQQPILQPVPPGGAPGLLGDSRTADACWRHPLSIRLPLPLRSLGLVTSVPLLFDVCWGRIVLFSVPVQKQLPFSTGILFL